MLFVLKTTYLIMLACPNICQEAWRVLTRFADIRQAVLRRLPRLADFRLSVLRWLAMLTDIRQPFCEYSPDSLTFAKGHFREKCDSPREFGASSHW
jgi:hypothetical protein